MIGKSSAVRSGISPKARTSGIPAADPTRGHYPRSPGGWARLGASLTVVGLLLAACANGDEEPEEGDVVDDVVDDEGSVGEEPGEAPVDDASLDEVVFLSVVPPESLTFAPELYAIASGIFEDHGLDVELQPTRGSAQAIQGILSELALIARVGDLEVMQAVGERGAEQLVTVATSYKQPNLRFVSSPDNPLTSAEDFADELIGIPSEGGTSELTVDLIGRSAGIENLNKQVVGLSPGTYDLVEDGRIAGYAVTLDTAVLLEETRDAVVYNPADALFSGGQVYLSNREMLQDEEDGTARDQTERFLASIREAIDDIIADEENGFENVLATLREEYDFDSLMNDAVAVGSMEQFVDSWTLDGDENILRTTEERWQGVYEEVVEVGEASPDQDPMEWWTNEYLPE